MGVTTMTSTAPATAPATAPTPQFSSLLGSTIESIIHELLYSRSIYPPDSFVLHRHLGVRCHASRVPQVGEYVSNFLRVAIPSVMSGIGDGICLIVLEELCDGHGRGGVSGDTSAGGGGMGERNGHTKAVERFEFRFSIDPIVGIGTEGVEEVPSRKRTIDDIEDADAVRRCAVLRDSELAIEARSTMERSMRECLLRVLALRRRRRGTGERAENMSFKLCLHVASTTTTTAASSSLASAGHRDESVVLEAATWEDAESCPELMDALGRGEWYRPEESSCLFSYAADGLDKRKGLLRPIKDVDLPSCGMKMQLGMEVDPFR
ncbi:hypothetical protein ACHAXA_005438 [Cyclostephanos tholiformis]|uniref:HORMA domain-containing protein n=1 Tax=Cyclostephanos tholiformis TaxID=382380 RepID=A0ABD3R2T8_9STRA